MFFVGLALKALGLVRAAISWVFGHPKVIPYLVIAVLALGVYMQHAKLRASRAETATTKSELHTAVAANQDDAATISALQKAIKDLTAQLGQAKRDGAIAADKAAQVTRALNQRLSAAQSTLSQLQGNPSYAAFLGTDLNALYPDIARSLRALDAPAQD